MQPCGAILSSTEGCFWRTAQSRLSVIASISRYDGFKLRVVNRQDTFGGPFLFRWFNTSSYRTRLFYDSSGILGEYFLVYFPFLFHFFFVTRDMSTLCNRLLHVFCSLNTILRNHRSSLTSCDSGKLTLA